MAGVSKGQFSNDDFMCIRACRDDGELRRRLEKKGRGFAFNSPNTKKKNARPKKNFFQDVEKTKKFDCNFSHRTQNDDDKNDDEFCSTRAEQVFVNTSERNVRVCVYVCI